MFQLLGAGQQKTIIVSGYSESGRVKEAERSGVDGFIQKPYKVNDISILLNKLLSNGEK